MNLIEFDITSSLQFFEGLVFGKIFVSFISVCFNNTWIAPLVNECPSPFFKISRGFWKGSPLSLILCILIAEALSQRLSVEEREINTFDIKIVCGTKRINHSQFVDESLLLGGCWLWSLIIFLIERSLLSAVFIPHEVFTPQKYVHSSTQGSAEGGYPLCGVQGGYPPRCGVWGQLGPQRGFGGSVPRWGFWRRSP
jgi:hypothetical protein